MYICVYLCLQPVSVGPLLLCIWLLLNVSIYAGNFPFLSPLFNWIVKRAPQGKGMHVLVTTAISMLQARRQNEEETKVL